MIAATAISLETSDGVRLSGRQWAASGAARAAVVVVHGFAGSSDEPRITALAEALADCGCVVLAYDARGHGASGGATTLGDHERYDVRAAIDTVAVDGVPIVVVGESMGAIAVLSALTTDSADVAGVVIVSCPARWKLPLNARGLIAALLTHTAPGRWLAREHMHIRIARHGHRPPPPIEMVTDVHAPIAVVHGRRDPFIAPRDAQALFDAANEPRRLTIVDGMAHSFEPTSVGPVVDAVGWVRAPAS